MVKNKPSVSIVVPVYNSEETVEDCLNSIILQENDFLELIVVDNNSNDGTRKILKDYAGRYSKIKYILEENKGRGSARNAGVKLAKGNIIVMTDADCIVSKNWIREIIKPIVEDGEKIVMGFQEDGVENYWTKQAQKMDLKFAKENAKEYIPHFDTKNVAVDASVMKKHLFDPRLKASEDLDFYLRVSPEQKIRFLKEVRVTHCHNLSFVEIVKVFFQRGFYSMKVIKKHINDEETKGFLKSNSIFSNLNLFKLFFRFLYRLFTSPLTCWYLFVIGVSWQIGALFGRFKN
ncbi:glycosyltransferase family 2 protein [archaeon]|nr:glycosyltransferase family 2 protein [archaeon]